MDDVERGLLQAALDSPGEETFKAIFDHSRKRYEVKPNRGDQLGIGHEAFEIMDMAIDKIGEPFIQFLGKSYASEPGMPLDELSPEQYMEDIREGARKRNAGDMDLTQVLKSIFGEGVVVSIGFGGDDETTLADLISQPQQHAWSDYRTTKDVAKYARRWLKYVEDAESAVPVANDNEEALKVREAMKTMINFVALLSDGISAGRRFDQQGLMELAGNTHRISLLAQIIAADMGNRGNSVDVSGLMGWQIMQNAEFFTVAGKGAFPNPGDYFYAWRQAVEEVTPTLIDAWTAPPCNDPDCEMCRKSEASVSFPPFRAPSSAKTD